MNCTKVLLASIFLFLVTGCASNQIMKGCKQVEGTNAMVCKTTLPWEDLESE